MDGGSSLNIIYLETLDLLGIKRTQLQPSAGGFHGVVPGKKALPVGRLDLPICFGTAANFRKEVLTFEVVGFRGTSHAIIGRPCYAKFMAIPNYTYLKLKMPGPKGVITVSSSYEHAYECDVECIEYGEAIENSTELASKLEALAAEAPEPKRHVGSFELTEGTKKIPLQRLRRQGADDQRRPRPKIGSRARRLSPCKCRHVCMESLRHARHTKGSRRALLGDASRFQASETVVASFRRR